MTKRKQPQPVEVPATLERAKRYLLASRDLKRAFCVAHTHEAQMFEALGCSGAKQHEEARRFGNGSVLLDIILRELEAKP